MVKCNAMVNSRSEYLIDAINDDSELYNQQENNVIIFESHFFLRFFKQYNTQLTEYQADSSKLHDALNTSLILMHSGEELLYNYYIV